VRVLSRLFRGKFLAHLHEAWAKGLAQCKGSTADLASPAAFAALKRQLYRREWVVYAKPPFAGARHVYRYLARYTHRVAIANSRLIDMQGGRVRFRYRDYADASHEKVMSLEAGEFIRRFLLHVLPRRFVRIRHYGLLASRNVAGKLEAARKLLDAAPVAPQPAGQDAETWLEQLARQLGDTHLTCPRCGTEKTRSPLQAAHAGAAFDAATVRLHAPAPIFDSS
jgi:hypothetical protein